VPDRPARHTIHKSAVRCGAACTPDTKSRRKEHNYTHARRLTHRFGHDCVTQPTQGALSTSPSLCCWPLSQCHHSFPLLNANGITSISKIKTIDPHHLNSHTYMKCCHFVEYSHETSPGECWVNCCRLVEYSHVTSPGELWGSQSLCPTHRNLHLLVSCTRQHFLASLALRTPLNEGLYLSQPHVVLPQNEDMAGTYLLSEKGTYPSRLPDTTEEEGDTATTEVRSGSLQHSLSLTSLPRFDIIPLPFLPSPSNTAPRHLLTRFSSIKDTGCLKELTPVTASSMRPAKD